MRMRVGHAFHEHADLVDPVLGVPELVCPEVAGGAVLGGRAGRDRDVTALQFLAGLARHRRALLPQGLRRSEGHPPGLDDLVDVAPLACVDVHPLAVAQARSVPEDAAVRGPVRGDLVVAQPTGTGPAVRAVRTRGDPAVLDPGAGAVVGLASVGDHRQPADPTAGMVSRALCGSPLLYSTSGLAVVPVVTVAAEVGSAGPLAMAMAASLRDRSPPGSGDGLRPRREWG